jgi:hypothetical protein
MQCYKCNRNCTTFLKVEVRVYREGREEPVNGCYGEWKVQTLPYCNRHEEEVRAYASTIGHPVSPKTVPARR